MHTWRECIVAVSSYISYWHRSAVAGITADANVLINFTRLTAQRYSYVYQESIPIERLMHMVCDLKQEYTQMGGQRPFGVSFLFAGWDQHYGFQLYQSDPSGNFAGWKATAIGSNNQAAQSILKSDYKDGSTTVHDALLLAVKVAHRVYVVTPIDICRCSTKQWTRLRPRQRSSNFPPLPATPPATLCTASSQRLI